jgi:bacteriocin biosynthesis cyclodehydratase domain-containing protein
VVVPEHGRGSELSDDLQSRGTPHLWAYTRDGRAVVGPLVTPGHNACLRCLDLLQTERDSAWPRLLAHWEQSAAVATPASVTLLAGLVAGQVQRWLAGEQHTCWGATLEEQPDGTVVRRLWPMHPDCGCGWSRPGCPAGPLPTGLE